MEYFIVCTAAVIVSGLTLFSGFGLGTLLMPVFAIFFPLEQAISATALVHFLNNIFKLGLIGRYANRRTAIHFGLPALFAAFIGAQLLLWLSGLSPLISYQFGGRMHEVLPVKLVVATLMLIFATLDILPARKSFSFDQKYLPLGGLLSGLFGGLSGHQGAMRSAFLLNCGLSKEAFIATGVVIACLVDMARLSMYGLHFAVGSVDNLALIFAATLSAFLGAYIGRRLIHKVTMRSIRIVVSVMLYAIAIGLATGLI